MSSNIITVRVCECCGNEFEARTTHTRFCSKRCNRKVYKGNIRDKKVENSLLGVELVRADKNAALNEKHFLTVKEACQLLSIGRTNLYEQINTGKLIVSKIGSRTIIPRKNIDKFINYTSCK